MQFFVFYASICDNLTRLNPVKSLITVQEKKQSFSFQPKMHNKWEKVIKQEKVTKQEKRTKRAKSTKMKKLPKVQKEQNMQKVQNIK